MTLLIAAGICSAAVPGENASDMDRFQGAWTVTSLTERGEKVPDKETQLLEVVVAQDKLTIKDQGKSIATYKFKLDEKQKPRSIDMTILEGDDKGKVVPGIY